jgi:hypothetical protein
MRVLNGGECKGVNWTHLDGDAVHWLVSAYSLSYNAAAEKNLFNGWMK